MKLALFLVLTVGLLVCGCGQPSSEAPPSDDPQELNEIGVGLLRQGRLEEAASTFRKALELRPEYPEALYNLGAVLIKKGQVREAIEALERSVELRPESREGLTLLALAHQLNGDQEKAEAVLARVSQLSPDPATRHFPFAVQVSAEEDLSVAITWANRLSDRHELDARISRVGVNGRWLYRVRIPAESRAAADRFAEQLRREEGLEPWIVKVE